MFGLDLLSLIVLAVVILIGYKFKMNTGLLGIVAAFILGFFVFLPLVKGGVPLAISSPTGGKARAVLAGWNSNLFLVITGITLFFSIARANGTLELITRSCVALVRGNRKLLPIMFFTLAAVISGIGPGNISTGALLWPLAAAVAIEEDVSVLLMCLAVHAGINVGGLSPLAPSGAIALNLAAAGGVEAGIHVLVNTGIAFAILFFGLYFIYGGWKYANKEHGVSHHEGAPQTTVFEGKHKFTLLVLAAMIVATVGFRLDTGLCAFTGAAILLLGKSVDEKTAFNGVPWATLVMVCGVGVLVNMIDKAGGITLLTQFLAKFSNESSASAIFLLSGGLMSAVASASGVVMPTLIPPAIKLAGQLSLDPLALINGVVIGAHLTGISPFSTGGALTMALAGDKTDKQKLFIHLLAIAVGSMLFFALLIAFGVVGYV